MAALPDWQPRLQQSLDPLAEQMSEQELLWASGYLAGVAAARVEHHSSAVESIPAVEAAAGGVLQIWYGSQTGNGRGVAERLAGEAQARGLSVELSDLAEISPRQIRKVKLLTLVVSTHGEGDPPDDAESLYEYLHGEQAPKLDGLRYSVFALGDSSYEHFCQTGKDFDTVLEKLGAERALARADADVDFEPASETWRTGVIEAFAEVGQSAQAPRTRLSAVPDSVPAWNRDNPWRAEVLASSPLTVTPSGKTVHHVELSLEGSGIRYEPGDSLGVWPRNPAPLAEEFLGVLKLDEAARVRINDDDLPARDWLSHRLELTQLTRPFLEQYAQAAQADELKALLADAGQIRAWIERHQVIDVLREFPAGLSADELFPMLRALAPRSYSVASSPLAAPGEVHLTVRTVGGWQAFCGRGFPAPTIGAGKGLPQEAVASPSAKRLRAGAASWHLNSGLKPGEHAEVFLEPNKRFRLPDDMDAPVIMIGPGTGVAPFRAFVEHRKALDAGGRNWLFFGEQHRRSDFLYQIEWQRHLKSGALHRLSLAFSRDQEHKVYVQDRIRDQGRDVYDWLEAGAHVYVCGDATRMAPDVEQVLLDVVAEHAGIDAERAVEYLKAMKRQGRYRKDVY